MELQNERLFDVRERRVRRWMLVLFALVVALGFPGVWFGPRVYSQWQQHRLYAQAQRLLQDGDPQRAVICLRRVLDLDPDHLEATRAMAGIAEIYVPGEALSLRERVCQLAPGSADDAKAWALAAVRFGQIAQADDAFDLMEKLGPHDAGHYRIGGRIARAAGRTADARAAFRRARELEPGNESDALELAAIEIRTGDADEQVRARAELERLRANPALRHGALRALIADHVAHGRIRDAAELAREFVDESETTFQDRLQYLGILRAGEDLGFAARLAERASLPLGMVRDSSEPTFTSYLSDLEAEAFGQPARMSALISFLNEIGQSLLACEWAGTLPREVRAAPPVAPALAEAYRLTRDWRRLDEFIAGANWGSFEFIRRALAARSARERGDQGAAAIEWAAAVKAAEFRGERLGALARMTASWGWPDEHEEVLRISAQNSKRPRQALEDLAEMYRARRNTAKLFAVCTRLFEMDPADVVAGRNWVRLSLLLQNEKYRTGQLAQEQYQRHPADPLIVASFALVQHFRELDAEGLALMNRLSAGQLREPSTAAIYGILLVANGRKQEAAEALAIARRATLLPEERALVETAWRALD